MIETKAICDSISPQNIRLMTMFWRYPKFLHQESLRHRTLYIHDCLYDPDFSFSVSSARAIPFRKLIDEVRSDELRAAPMFWGCEQKGMSPGDELTGEALEVAKLWWKRAALDAAKNAEFMARAEGVLDTMPWDIPHKSIVNRIIEPYIHVNCLVTGTNRGWMNFFGLRLDKAADPTLQILAQESWKIWNESKPNLLQPGEWHLPYNDRLEDLSTSSDPLLPIKVSVARCARLSYLSFDTNKRSTIEEDLKLYDRLLGSNPIHASPAEHQATPDEEENEEDWKKYREFRGHDNIIWKYPFESGNLGSGWRQFRKMLAGEAVAPLPESYVEITNLT